MNLYKLFFVLLALVVYESAADEKIRYDNFKVYRLTPKTEKAVEILTQLSNQELLYDFWTEVRGVGQPVDVMVAPHLKYRFTDILTNTNDIDVEVYISDVQKLIDDETPLKEKAADFDWTSYQTLDQINQWLNGLTEVHPDTVTVVTAGKSYEGRDILGVKVSFNPENENRTVFIESNIHAREWISSAVTTWILNEILTSTDPIIRKVAEAHDWYFVPVFNPDGFVYTHTRERMWRKTRVPYGFCVGADPNRNWGYHFNDGGSSGSSCSDSYRGPKAFSEPLTKSISEFIEPIGSKLRAYIAFHSYSQIILLPYGYTNQRLDNYNDLMNVGQKAATSLAQRYNTKYNVGNIVDMLYTASGGSMDWVKGTFKTPITYTYELRDTGRYGFILPANQIIPSGEETLDSLITILEEFDKIL